MNKKKIYVYISQILDNTEVTNAEDPFGYKQLNKHNVHEIHCYTKYHLLPQEGSWWGEVNGEIYEVSTKRSPTNEGFVQHIILIVSWKVTVILMFFEAKMLFWLTAFNAWKCIWCICEDTYQNSTEITKLRNGNQAI